MKKPVTLMALAAVVFVTLGLYVWLTPYKYDHIKFGDRDFPVRINRVTGKTEVFMMGWKSFEDATERKVENPQPWNARALIASYDGMNINENDRHIRFYYIVENTTDQDYRVETNADISLTAKLAQPQSLAPFDDNEQIQYPIFIPSKQRLRVSIEMQYPSPSIALEHDEQGRSIFVELPLKNLDGFVLFDSNKRYQINFPKPNPPLNSR